MQQHPLLQTKLYIPPIRRELVSRPRLIERLNAGLDGKLTVISAPAGFGKTTLVSEWVHEVGAQHAASLQVAWLSLDEGDNDLTLFLAYMIAALRTVEASIGKGALGALESPQPPPAEVVLTSLINDAVPISSPIVLVLDDYHLIEAQGIHDALTFLLERLPPRMHLVIASREDPPLPLARLRARGQMTELRASDLRFTSSEAAEFLNRVMGLRLSAEDIAALESRTEGWIAGLQLAAISMQGREDTASLVQSFTGSHRYVLDYLVAEVLEQQSESVQAFLIETAILDRLTGALCDAVRFGRAKSPGSSVGTALAGQEDGQATLEMLERANLFIVPLDEERRWYRYHHLFADLLRQRLRRIQPGQLPILHRRASEWYGQRGFADEAIEHALRAEDYEWAECLIEDNVDAVWKRGEHTKLWRWFARLPVERVRSNPQLCIFQAWILFASGRQDAAEASLQAAEDMLRTHTELATETAPMGRGPLLDSDRKKIQGRAATIRAHLGFYRGDVEETKRYSRQALDYLPEQDIIWRNNAMVALGDAYSIGGDMLSAAEVKSTALEVSKATGSIYMVLVASMRLAITMRMQGKLDQVTDICQRQAKVVIDSGLAQITEYGFLLAIWGEVLAEVNDLDGALRLAERSRELTERDRDVGTIGWSYLSLIRILFCRGEIDGAEQYVQKTKDVARESHVPPWITTLMAVWQVRIWLAKGELEAASQWLVECGLDVDGDLTYQREAEYIVLARVLTAQGRLHAATRLLQRLLEPAEAGERTTRVIEMLMLQALAFRAGGDTAGAMTALERALALAEPRGFVRAFVDEGPPMAHLLYEAATRGISPDYTRRLLAAFPVAETEESESATPREASQAAMVEPLSERELEVLQLIAGGLTNREIASRLFLSLNTIKAHTRNIYGKLGVHNRTQAVTTARALGILPSP